MKSQAVRIKAFSEEEVTQREMEDWGLRLEINEQHSSGWLKTRWQKGSVSTRKGLIEKKQRAFLCCRHYINFSFNAGSFSFPISVVLCIYSASWCSVASLHPLARLSPLQEERMNLLVSVAWESQKTNSTWTPIIEYPVIIISSVTLSEKIIPTFSILLPDILWFFASTHNCSF